MRRERYNTLFVCVCVCICYITNSYAVSVQVQSKIRIESKKVDKIVTGHNTDDISLDTANASSASVLSLHLCPCDGH